MRLDITDAAIALGSLRIARGDDQLDERAPRLRIVGVQTFLSTQIQSELTTLAIMEVRAPPSGHGVWHGSL